MTRKCCSSSVKRLAIIALPGFLGPVIHHFHVIAPFFGGDNYRRIGRSGGHRNQVTLVPRWRFANRAIHDKSGQQGGGGDGGKNSYMADPMNQRGNDERRYQPADLVGGLYDADPLAGKSGFPGAHHDQDVQHPHAQREDGDTEKQGGGLPEGLQLGGPVQMDKRLPGTGWSSQPGSLKARILMPNHQTG